MDAFYRTDPSIAAPRQPSPPTVPVSQRGYVTAQPWQCKPWLDAQTLGCELRWRNDCDLLISNRAGVLDVELIGDYQPSEVREVSVFSDEYYGICTLQQILLPAGFNTLILPHLGRAAGLPEIVPGVLELDWWPAFFFVVSTWPKLGESHCIRAGQAYCQLVPVPREPLELQPMSPAEAEKWQQRADFVRQHAHSIATHVWTTDSGAQFGNAYKVLSRQVRSQGWQRTIERYSHDFTSQKFAQSCQTVFRRLLNSFETLEAVLADCDLELTERMLKLFRRVLRNSGIRQCPFCRYWSQTPEHCDGCRYLNPHGYQLEQSQ
jgi:hypothetical protein